MTISAPLVDARHRSCAAFTLTEILVSATIGCFIMAAVLSAMLFINRTGLRASGYSELETDVRRALETFAQDARLAENIRWNSAQSITFTLPAGSPATQVTYAYDATPGSATRHSFYRVEGDANTSAGRRVLVRHVDASFAFHRYKLEPALGGSDVAANDLETKQIQVTLSANRSVNGTAGASQQTASARYVLRNKRTGN